MTGDRGAFEGRQLGGYRILSLLGAGGMGEVYRARDVKLGREVALKVLLDLPQAIPSPCTVREEARLASVLNHPNIVTIYGVGRKVTSPSSRWSSCEAHAAVLLTESALHVEEVLNLAAPLADALAAAHATASSHRDLKPENLMVPAEGWSRCWFRLAKRPRGIESSIYSQDLAATRVALTQEGVCFGTVWYIPPEQAAGRPAATAFRSVRFGVLLYEMLSGRRPFDRDNRRRERCPRSSANHRYPSRTISCRCYAADTTNL